MQQPISLSVSKKIRHENEIPLAVRAILDKAWHKCGRYVTPQMYIQLKEILNAWLMDRERDVKWRQEEQEENDREAKRRKIMDDCRQECNQKIRSKLGEDELHICPVCSNDELDVELSSTVLSCQHYLCQSCVERMTKHVDGVSEISCPLCRTITILRFP